MATLARFLWGYRDDLKLNERWWHRLAKVLLVLLTVAAVGAIVAAVNDHTPSPSKINVVVIQTLDGHRKLAPSFVTLTFTALPGDVGVLNDDGSIGQWLEDYEVAGGECRSDSPRVVGTAVRLERRPNPFDEVVAQMYPGKSIAEDLEGFVIPDTPGDKEGHCFLPRLTRGGIPFRPFNHPFEQYVAGDPAHGYVSGLPLEILAADRIVKWKYSVIPFVQLAALLVVVFAICIVGLLNAYYRGLIYVAFGPRRPAL